MSDPIIQVISTGYNRQKMVEQYREQCNSRAKQHTYAEKMRRGPDPFDMCFSDEIPFNRCKGSKVCYEYPIIYFWSKSHDITITDNLLVYWDSEDGLNMIYSILPNKMDEYTKYLDYFEENPLGFTPAVPPFDIIKGIPFKCKYVKGFDKPSDCPVIGRSLSEFVEFMMNRETNS